MTLILTGYLSYYNSGDSVPRGPAFISSLLCYGEETRVFDCSYEKSNESEVCSTPLRIWCYSGNLYHFRHISVQDRWSQYRWSQYCQWHRNHGSSGGWRPPPPPYIFSGSCLENQWVWQRLCVFYACAWSPPLSEHLPMLLIVLH